MYLRMCVQARVQKMKEREAARKQAELEKAAARKLAQQEKKRGACGRV